MLLLRFLAALLFIAVAGSYFFGVAASLEAETVNHFQVGVLICSVYFLISVIGHDSRDRLLKRIAECSERSDENATISENTD